MLNRPLDEYFAALERIKRGKGLIVPKGTKITNDAVALEAGRGKGSIKKSRDIFADLIKAIDDAAIEQAYPKNEQKERINKVKSVADQCRRSLEESLAREVSLVMQVYELKKEIARLTGAKVLPIRGK
jgi:hypothetical protein